MQRHHHAGHAASVPFRALSTVLISAGTPSSRRDRVGPGCRCRDARCGERGRRPPRSRGPPPRDSGRAAHRGGGRASSPSGGRSCPAGRRSAPRTCRSIPRISCGCALSIRPASAAMPARAITRWWSVMCFWLLTPQWQARMTRSASRRPGATPSYSSAGSARPRIPGAAPGISSARRLWQWALGALIVATPGGGLPRGVLDGPEHGDLGQQRDALPPDERNGGREGGRPVRTGAGVGNPERVRDGARSGAPPRADRRRSRRSSPP